MTLKLWAEREGISVILCVQPENALETEVLTLLATIILKLYEACMKYIYIYIILRCSWYILCPCKRDLKHYVIKKFQFACWLEDIVDAEIVL